MFVFVVCVYTYAYIHTLSLAGIVPDDEAVTKHTHTHTHTHTHNVQQASYKMTNFFAIFLQKSVP